MIKTNTEILTKYFKKSGVSSASDSFVETLHKCKNQGLESAPRGQKVRELFLETLTISPTFPLPDFASREFNWKYFAGELAWYMGGGRTTDYIDNFSNFWKSLKNPDGTINSNYGNLLFGKQIIWAYESLVKDENSRQAISFISRPDFQYEGNKDFVCTVYLNFWIRNGELNMKVQMRSNDLFYGFTYDVPFFAVVMQTMWHNLRKTYPDLQLGKYYHCADNIHYYERHFELADKILSENHEENPPHFFYMKEPLFIIHSDHLEFTSDAQKFKETMDIIVNSGEITQQACKNALQTIFLIQ
jgi:thymidylate synthase